MVWQALAWNEPALNFYRKYNAKFDNEWLNISVDFWKAPSIPFKPRAKKKKLQKLDEVTEVKNIFFDEWFLEQMNKRFFILFSKK